jgi:hypothetical protein
VLFGGSEQGNPLLSDTWEYAATCDGVAGPEFGNPAPVAELRMPGSYGVSPTVDARQHDIWWISNRPGGLGGSDVWHASRASVSAPWSGIQNVPELNSSGGENSVSVRGDGRVIYFSSTRPGGPVGEKLWQSSRDPGGPWTPPTLVPGVNLSTYQGGPSVSPDGQELFFSSNGPGSLGLNAIWTSTFNPQTSAWNPPTRIAELDSAFNEYSPALSADGKRLYFTSNRPGGTGGYDIYVACRAARGQPWNLWRPASELESASDDWSSCETPDGYSQYLVRDADVHRADRFFPRLVGPTSGPTPGVATFLLRRNPGNLGVIAIGVDALPPTSVPPILGDLLMIPLVLLANSVHDADGNVTLMLPIASAPGAIVRFQGMSQDLATGLYYLSNRIDFLLR